jgi:predicted glycoside hydrolase/deacetylase ChbG (UPF0249 family)
MGAAAVRFKSDVGGIPCLIEVTRYVPAVPDTGLHGRPEDYSPGSDAEIDWNVLDRNGRRAEWLERKLSDVDYDRISEEAIAQMQRRVELDRY